MRTIQYTLNVVKFFKVTYQYIHTPTCTPSSFSKDEILGTMTDKAYALEHGSYFVPSPTWAVGEVLHRMNLLLVIANTDYSAF